MDCPNCELDYTATPIRIVFCHLHAAAEKLRDALNRAAKLAHKNTNGHSYWLSFQECKHATCAEARAALNEVKETK